MILLAGTIMMPFYLLFTAYGTIAVALLAYYMPKFKEEGADITPFLGLFTLETIAWWITILS